MPRTVWLASYPKSGNTWFRIFLANLLHPEQAPVDLNQLPERTPIASSRGHFDDLLGVPSALLTQAEIDRLRPAADAELARAWDEPLLLRKAHDAYTRLPDGTPLMGQGPDFSAIYILRDPWDVAVSMTNHFNCDLDQAVANLTNPEFAVAVTRRKLNGQLRQHPAQAQWPVAPAARHLGDARQRLAAGPHAVVPAALRDHEGRPAARVSAGGALHGTTT